MLFSSRTKLLLTGEYLVMLGAKALALPLKFSQSLVIEDAEGENVLHWSAMESGITWFEAKYDVRDFEIISASDSAIASSLCKILKAAGSINTGFLKSNNSILAKTDIDFNREWGLGTSSTLISNIAWWANIDPFQLHWKVSEGSGYDIACARETKPIIYSVENHTPTIKSLDFTPPFSENTYFVYLGNKQNSAVSIQNIEKDTIKYKNEIDSVSAITDAFVNCGSIEEAKKLIAKHEEIIGSVLRQTPVKKSLFNDFSGEIKSLGAWGGDFVMVLSEEPAANIINYFKKKRLNTIFPFKEIIRSVW